MTTGLTLQNTLCLQKKQHWRCTL